MRKIAFILILLALCSLSAMAGDRAGRAEWGLNGGWQGGDQWVGDSPVWGMDVSYNFTDTFALGLDSSYASLEVGDTHLRTNLWIEDIVAIFTVDAGDFDEIAFAFGLGEGWIGWHDITGSGDGWAGKAYIEWKHFLGGQWAFDLKASFNHLAFSPKLNIWDIRAGFSYRF